MAKDNGLEDQLEEEVRAPVDPRIDASRRDDDQAEHTGALHRHEHIADANREHGDGRANGGRPKAGDHRTAPLNGRRHRRGIEHVALHDNELGVLQGDLARRPSEHGDVMPGGERLLDEEKPGGPGGSEDSELHGHSVSRGLRGRTSGLNQGRQHKVLTSALFFRIGAHVPD